MKPTSMRGGGYYDQHSSIQRNTNIKTIPQLQKAVGEIAVAETASHFCLVDFGSSEGKNSQDCIEAVVDILIERNNKIHIMVVHNDLPNNDFNRLFKNVHEASSYYVRHKQNGAQISVMAVAGSFYEQVMPKDSVHLGFSSWACQWLSQSPPVRLADHIYFGGAKEANRLAFARQADADLITFLSKRAIELTKGGKLVLVIPSGLGDPLDGNGTAGGAMNLLNRQLQALVAEGYADKQRYEDFMFPFYFRTLEETISSIRNSSMEKIFALNVAQEEKFPCPFYSQYLEDKDIDAYGNRYVNWLRAWSEPIIATSIFAGNQEQIDLLYGRIKEAVQQKPEDYIFNVSVIFLTLTKL